MCLSSKLKTILEYYHLSTDTSCFKLCCLLIKGEVTDVNNNKHNK